MLCRNPYLNNQGMLFPCGQCMPCRVNRRREWTHRILLEKKLKSDNCFVTLTYQDDQLPMSATGCPTLNPAHFTNWLKRFRAAIHPLKIRYYGVGEYGDTSWRPHYHAVVFGFPMCSRGRTLRDARTRVMWKKCCTQCQTVGETWTHGDIECGEVNEESAQYVAGYTTKKMTAKDDFRLGDRHPEFARMSLKPGIGAGFIPYMADSINQMAVDLVAEQGDVPSALRHGSRIMPIGRYLRRRLREEVGLGPEAPASTIAEAQRALQPLRDRAFENSRSFKKEVLEEYDNQVKSMENKQRIFKKRDVL